MQEFLSSLIRHFKYVVSNQQGFALITKTYTFSAGATILASEHNQNFDVLYNWANGNVDNANIKASAGISLSKLSLGDDVTFTGDFNFTNAATTDNIVTITGSSLTTGSALRVYSNSASTSTRSLLHIINDHADADDTVCLLIQQDGADYAIDCGATGKIRGDLSNSTFPNGRVVQVVNTQSGAAVNTTEAIPFDDSIPTKTEGTELYTLKITPKSATNTLLIQAKINIYPDGVIALFKNDDAAALCVSYEQSGAAYAGYSTTLNHYVVAGGTDEITFKLRYGHITSGTAYINSQADGRKFGGVLLSSLTITEIQA
jgi:hypothetical protein